MKIVFDGLIYYLQKQGGISRYFDELINGLAEKPGCEVTVLMRKNQINNGFSKKIKVEVLNSTIYSGNKVIKYFSVILDRYAVNKYLKHNNLEDTVFHYTYYAYYKNLKAKTVLTVYDLIHEKFPSMFNGALNVLYLINKKNSIKKASTLITISDNTKSDVMNIYGVKPENIHTTRLGLSSDFRTITENEKKIFLKEKKLNRPFAIFIGNRSLYKNFAFTLETFADWEKNTTIDLCCIGGGEFTHKEKNLIENLELNNQVKLYPFVSEKELVSFYNCSTALVFPSLYEGFGLPLLEAMACGTKVLASDIRTFHEIGGKVPIYFNPKDKESIIEALDQALLPDETRIKSGLELIKKYTWENTVSQTLQVYDKITR